ncbi:Tetratricopeptide repeat (TPR)-like superfamily protein [Euphorbia peplus]|nr:Tetratricopeptide repeat (TPR)-like superfamily protein [Euphorbia peplus]
MNLIAAFVAVVTLALPQTAMSDVFTAGKNHSKARLAVKRGEALFRQVGRDRRRVMREAYKMFKDGGDPEKFVNAFRGGPYGYFYASLYAGLYYESQNEENAAKHHMVSAYKTPYGQNSHQYMADVAKVHYQRQNWID